MSSKEKSLRFLWLLSVTVFAFCFSFNPIFAIGDYEPGSKLTVLASSGLNLREKPNPAAKKLTLIPFGSKVSVTSRLKDNPITIDGIKGNWVEISFQKWTGFAFDGYLSSFQAPPKGCKNFKDYLTKTIGKGKSEIVPAGDYEGRSAIRFGVNILYMTEGGDSWDLYFPGISMEELFLIGRVCKEIKSKTLELQSGGNFEEVYGNLMSSMYLDENSVVIFRRQP